MLELIVTAVLVGVLAAGYCLGHRDGMLEADRAARRGLAKAWRKESA